MTKRIFGMLDILTGLALILLYFNFFNLAFLKGLAVFIFILFLIKSLVFLPNIASIMDIMGGAFFVLALFGIFSPITWLVVVWFLQKGIVSLI